MNQIKHFLSLVKFSHTIFAMPFAFIGFFWAIKLENFEFSFLTFVLVLIDMVWARNAAMAFNRYIDRHIDKANERTAVRDIPAGKISEKAALFFIILNSLLFMGTTYFINQLTFFLSPVALLVVLGYSYTKRFTWLCHIVLGLGLALAPIGAYISVTSYFSVLPIMLSFLVLFWVSGFDVIYALQDEGFDKSQNLKSIPVLMGKKGALWFSSILHILVLILVFFIGYTAKLGYLYWTGASIFSVLLIYQHLIVKPNDLSRVNLAFFTSNGIASVVFGLFTILDLFL
jgi:4-hydroxybenzoate polyprenyltransferase